MSALDRVCYPGCRAKANAETLADVTRDYLTEKEKEEARRKSRIFAGNLSDGLLHDLGISARRIALVRKADRLSLFDLENIPPATRHKIHELSRLPADAVFRGRAPRPGLGYTGSPREVIGGGRA